MSAEPTRIVIQERAEREPRERPVRFDKIDLDAILVPAFFIGGFFAVALYKDQIVEFLKDGFEKLGSKELADLIEKIVHPDVEPLKPIDLGNLGGGGGGGPVGGNTIYTSNLWSQGGSRTMTKHEEFDKVDKRVWLAAGSNRKLTIDGRGNASLQGDQARIYIDADNYNSFMQLKARARSGLDNLSLKLRSRHGEGGSCENRFGGYGMSFHFKSNEVESKREDCHNIHTTIGSCRIPKLSYDREYTFGFSCQDSGSSVVLKGYIDGKLVCTLSDKNPKGYMRNKGSFDKRSYLWIRTNGGGGVTVRDVVVKEIGPLASARIAYQWPSGLPQDQLMQYYNNYYPYPYARNYDKKRRKPLEMRVSNF